MSVKIQELKKQYDFICNEYIKKFCNKQKIDFNGWVGDDVGGIAIFIEQYFFNLSDIILDVNTKQKKGLILEWQDDSVDFNLSKENKQYINYNSYIMGLRYNQLKS